MAYIHGLTEPVLQRFLDSPESYKNLLGQRTVLSLDNAANKTDQKYYSGAASSADSNCSSFATALSLISSYATASIRSIGRRTSLPPKLYEAFTFQYRSVCSFLCWQTQNE